jgi:mannose-6-phosphate isomerase-like protein (cupin superfamily)
MVQLLLDHVLVENYQELMPDMNSKKPNGFRGFEKGDSVYINPEETIQFLSVIEFLPDKGLRGNHYHKHKNEILYIISGRVKAFYWRCNDPENKVTCIHEKGTKITIPPLIGHGFEALEFTLALEMTTTPFDSTDTYYHDKS